MPSTILSIGSGGGLHEAYLAATDQATMVVGADLRSPDNLPSLPNLKFEVGDLLNPKFRSRLAPSDFVYSIECLEHIEDDDVVLEAMIDRVRPGGWLYVQVPFANDEEQADTVLCRGERERFGHVRPGYSGPQLRQKIEAQGLQVVLVAGAFWSPIQPMVWSASEKFGSEMLSRYWRDVFDVAALDLREGLPKSRSDATAIKILARKSA